MNITEYQQWAWNKCSEHGRNLEAAWVGVTFEAAEFGDVLKKRLYQDHPLDEALLKKLYTEAGDVVFYIAILAKVAGFELDGQLTGDRDLKLAKPKPLAALRETMKLINITTSLHLDKGHVFSSDVKYVTSMAFAYMQLDFKQVIATNVEKLNARYKDGFTKSESVNRKE